MAEASQDNWEPNVETPKNTTASKFPTGAGAVVFETLMGIEFWSGALLIVIITGCYTILGGLRAVIYTDALQAMVLIVGSITISVIGLMKIGGWVINNCYFDL